MNSNDAGRVIAVVDKRINRHLKSEAKVETTWGTVCGITADGKYASAYLYGETEFPSNGFRIPGSLAVAVGDAVKVAWDGRGDRWVYDIGIPTASKKIEIDQNAGTIKVGDGTARPSLLIADSSGVVVGVHNHDADYSDIAHVHSDPATLRLTGTGDASLASTDHAFQIGPTSGNNVIIDQNEIMARANGGVADLHLNAEGGRVRVNGLQMMGAGTSFPASPIAGDIFFRTDRGLEYYSDGTRWLCTCPHVVALGDAGTFTTTRVMGRIPHPGTPYGWSIWVEDFTWTGYLLGGSGLNDGTNYWQGICFTIDGGGSSLIAYANSSNLGATQITVWAAHGAAYASTTEAFELRWHEIGSPYDIADIGSTMRWRYIG